jgi:hypothetical protein
MTSKWHQREGYPPETMFYLENEWCKIKSIPGGWAVLGPAIHDYLQFENLEDAKDYGEKLCAKRRKEKKL